VYGKSEKRTSIVEGRARRSYGHGKPIGTWEAMIKDHHEGYIGWTEYERNQSNSPSIIRFRPGAFLRIALAGRNLPCACHAQSPASLDDAGNHRLRPVHDWSSAEVGLQGFGDIWQSCEGPCPARPARPSTCDWLFRGRPRTFDRLPPQLRTSRTRLLVAGMKRGACFPGQTTTLTRGVVMPSSIRRA
jgi:hypothetical protein